MINQAKIWPGLFNCAYLSPSTPIPFLFKPKAHLYPKDGSSWAEVLTSPLHVAVYAVQYTFPCPLPLLVALFGVGWMVRPDMWNPWILGLDPEALVSFVLPKSERFTIIARQGDTAVFISEISLLVCSYCGIFFLYFYTCIIFSSTLWF
jgi:hypothetical protein